MTNNDSTKDNNKAASQGGKEPVSSRSTQEIPAESVPPSVQDGPPNQPPSSAAAPPAEKTPPSQPETSQPPPKAKPAAEPGKTQTSEPKAADKPEPTTTPATVEKQICANCGAENKKSDVYCYRCGQLLPSVQLPTEASDKAPQQPGSDQTGDSAEHEESADDDSRPGTRILGSSTDHLVLPKKRWGTARLENEALIILRVKETKEEIHIYLQDQEIVMGRSYGDAEVDVDLTPHNAVEFGVSRRHAMLKRQNDNVVVTDLGSINHTYLNGAEIIPNEFRILRDGDELRLGKLVLRAHFGETM